MLAIKKLVLIALLAASALVIQIGLAVLPNIELVSLWFLIVARKLSFKENLLVIFIFTLLEGLVWGFGDWVLGYLWIWTLWTVLVKGLSPLIKDRAPLWALVGALFGFSFGFLFALQHALLYGLNMGLIYWVRGIPFDIIHAFGNYILILLFYKPLMHTFEILLRKWVKSE